MKRTLVVVAVLAVACAFAALAFNEDEQPLVHAAMASPQGTDNSIQPVNITNWPIDADGNLMVSIYPRDKVLDILDIPIDASERPWYSDWFDTSAYNRVYGYVRFGGNAGFTECNMQYEWIPGEFTVPSARSLESPAVPLDVNGPRGRIQCRWDAPGTLNRVVIYLRRD